MRCHECLTLNMKQFLTIRWLSYHLLTLLKLPLLFHPFRFGHGTSFRPGAPFVIFLFATVSALLVYFPIFLIIGNMYNTGHFYPELLIVTGFGLAMSIFYRWITGEASCIVSYDLFKVTFVTYGFLERRLEHIPLGEVEGLGIFRTSHRGTKNHKICLIRKKGRPIMIYLTVFEKKAHRKLKELSQSMGLEMVKYPGGIKPVNDITYS